MHRVRMLIYFGVIPYLVFDGDNLPSKASTESERAKRRLESKRRGLELYKANKVSQAYPEFQKSIDVTPYMARQLIEELKKMDIQYVVAPYEADAQLAYLEKKGIIDGILSEDSDLLVYGAKKLITKLDQHGDCIEIRRSDFASCRDMTLAGFTDAEFRLMAILSGCDYLANINKVGLKTAHTYVRKYKSVERILRMLQFEQKFVVPGGYLEKFYEAERTFLHHRVFCPLQKKLVLFTELGDDMKEEDMPYLGHDVSPTVAIGVACGDLDPMTKKQIPINVATASRSMPDLYRRRTVTSAHELKPSKSIDTFFKPKRQPLAELDPNSLTPSPSQQRLLNLHRNTSWEARPISSAPQLRRTASVLPDLLQVQTGQPQPRDRCSFLQRAATLSTFQPPKRTRLCSDMDISPSGKDGQSPFFAAKPDPSPSIRKRGKTKKARLSDMEIFSDDSVADVFQDVQAPFSEPVPIVLVGQAEKGTRPTERASSPITNPVTEICDTPVRRKVQVTQSGTSQSTSAISIGINDDSEEFQDLFEMHAKELNSFRNTFAYQSPARQAAALRGLSPPSVGSQSIAQAEVRIGESYNHNNALTQGSTRAGEIQSRYKASMHKTFSTQSPHQQAAALKSIKQTQSPSQKVKLGLAALESDALVHIQQRPLTPLQQLGQRALQKKRNPSYDHEAPPAASNGAVTAAAGTKPSASIAREVRVQGSEDVLVPQSDDEVSQVSGIEDVEPVRRNVDLKRFAFTANNV
jgi:exonuclease 1